MRTTLTIFFTILIFFYAFNFLALNRKFYAFLHWQLQLPVQEETLRLARENVLDFIKDKNTLNAALFTPREHKHLSDIKSIMELEKLLFLAFVDVFLVLYFYYFFIKKKRTNPLKPWRRRVVDFDLLLMLKDASQFGLFVTPVASLILLFGFGPLFTFFHQAIFPNDFWLLDPNKHLLINILPPQFFLLWLVYFFVLCVFTFFVIFIASLYIKKSSK